MVDYSGLENRRAERHRGFESLSLRKEFSKRWTLFLYLRGMSHPPVGGSRVQQMLDSFFVFKRNVSPTGRGFLLRFPTQASPCVAERESLSLRYQKELSNFAKLFFYLDALLMISLFSFLFFRVFLKLSHVFGFHCSALMLPFLYPGSFFLVL